MKFVNYIIIAILIFIGYKLIQLIKQIQPISNLSEKLDGLTDTLNIFHHR